jgi:hypothetical protein
MTRISGIVCISICVLVLGKVIPSEVKEGEWTNLVGSVVIDTELGRDDHGFIPATAIWRGLEPLDARTDSQPDLNGGEKPKNKQINNYLFNVVGFFLTCVYVIVVFIAGLWLVLFILCKHKLNPSFFQYPY